MKKISTVAISLALGLTLLLTGCGSSITANKTSAENKPAESAAASQTAQPAPKAIKDWKYYSADQLKEAIEKKSPLQIVDIQVEAEYDAHHIKGVIPTYAYPVKTEEEKAKLAKILPQLKASKDPIVIVCPAGKGGAERTYQYLYDQGIDESRLFTLEKGQSGWPYSELLEK
ncbi:rhodanese-like domain-containing protein [Desulfosporosinus nitroreducens]|uniref:rhodanese-like domain-containing protein n=1 Tax=Desulfosporosinus nitroreducens TaxID=2018668 RepID=UPI00207C25D3|nr:rhodanese-like domain-containing protein [Desulfosporosinus nitroreducens]MCO1601945.1 rhodanese-like domain-containing protein [Desulfosporosinus nitroreducens]